MEENYGEIIDILEEIFGEHRHHNDYKGQISFDCPVCSYQIKGLDDTDGRGNLEINYKRGIYRCWVCSETYGTHGFVLNLVKRYGNKKQIRNFELFMPDELKKIEKPTIQVELPKEFIRLSTATPGFKMTHHYKMVMNYLKKRSITDLMIQIHDIGFCYQGEYICRVIIPSYNDDHKLNYFVARSYLDNVKNKYKNPEADKETIIWNEHLIDWNETVYIVEGVFDSIFVSNSIPMLGKYMTNKLFHTLYEKAKKIVIVLDPDAREDQNMLYHKLNCGKLMGRVYVIELEGNKDIADLKGNFSGYQEKKLD